MPTTSVKIAPGDAVLVSSATPVDPDYTPPGVGAPGSKPPPVDPGYGIDVGLGWLRPTHPIAGVPPPIPTHPIELPPPAPVDPAYGIDADLGYLRPTHPIALPGKPELKWELKTAWSPTTGWVVIAIPTGPVATPSKK